MTEIRKKIPVPETTRDEVRIECDLCGAVSGNDGEWGRDLYFHDEVTIVSEKHTHYPYSGTREGEAFDSCPKCFQEKVRPALVALGLKPRKVRVTW